MEAFEDIRADLEKPDFQLNLQNINIVKFLNEML